MGRRVEAPERPDVADGEILNRRLRNLGLRLRLCVPAVGDDLSRDLEGVTNPAERLALAEAAYLTAFPRLPWGSA